MATLRRRLSGVDDLMNRSRSTASPCSPRSGRSATRRSGHCGPVRGPSLQFDAEIRTIICATNAIESINARIHRAVDARGHFPRGQAALKFVCLAILSLYRQAKGKRCSTAGGRIRNAFKIASNRRLFTSCPPEAIKPRPMTCRKIDRPGKKGYAPD